MKKNIQIIELGGTISAEGEDRLDGRNYISGKFDGIDFIEQIPELHTIANVRFETFLRVSSTAVTSAHWLQLRNRVSELLKSDDCDGVVITHGTNTLEETAYFLHLTVPSPKPIVLVGSQRPFTQLSSDAHMNIVQAVQVAAADEAHGLGVLVVLNNQISSARDVTKTNTYHLHTFQNGDAGFLGYIDADGSVQFYRKPVKKHTIHSAFANEDLSNLPEVAITYSHAGADEHLIDAIIASEKYAGIITAGTGAGLIAPLEIDALKRAVVKGITVVRSSRVGNGRVVPITPYKGSGFLVADNLLPQKARILLMLALEKEGSSSIKALQEYFYEY